MYTLGPEEKTTTVIAYTPNMLVRGDLVSMQSTRVGIWLRTDSAPAYLHMLKPQILVFGGGAPKSLSYPEILLPVSEMIGFHMVPPASEPPDYDPNEPNRTLDPTTILMATFVMKGKLRKAAQTTIPKAIELARSVWMSFYEVDISNPNLPQMNMTVPMMLITPARVSFVIE